MTNKVHDPACLLTEHFSGTVVVRDLRQLELLLREERTRVFLGPECRGGCVQPCESSVVDTCSNATQGQHGKAAIDNVSYGMCHDGANTNRLAAKQERIRETQRSSNQGFS